MNQVIFDTHAFVKRLTAVGMPEAQAEVLADEQARLIDERLSTKTDLRETEARLGGELRETEARLGGELRALEARLESKLRELEASLESKLRELDARLKSDLRELEVRLNKNAVELEARLSKELRTLELQQKDSELRLQAKIDAGRTDVVKWTVGAVGLQTLVLLGALIALAKSLH